MNGILTDSTTPDKSGPGSNSNEEGIHTTQSSRTGALLSDAV